MSENYNLLREWNLSSKGFCVLDSLSAVVTPEPYLHSLGQEEEATFLRFHSDALLLFGDDASPLSFSRFPM